MTTTILKEGSQSLWFKVRGFIDWREQGQVGMMIGKMMQGMFGPGGLIESNMKRFYVEYHENIRQIVPKGRLLEYRVQDGYKPLCDFLGVPVPTKVIDEKEIEESFPRVNEGASFADRMTVCRKLQNKRLLKKAGTVVSIAALVGAGLWYLRR
jgi:Sulfotransferase domain